MLKGVHLTLMIGPLVPIPVPQVVIDSLTSVEVTTSDNGPSVFQLSFSLSNQSPLQILFLLTGGQPILFLRVVIVITLNGAPDVIMDGVITNHQLMPGQRCFALHADHHGRGPNCPDEPTGFQWLSVPCSPGGRAGGAASYEIR